MIEEKLTEASEQFIKLFKLLPGYYATINKRDPLFIVLMSVVSTMAMLSLVFRRKPALQLFIMSVNLLLVVATAKISAFFQTREQLMLDNKMITQRYFDVPGKFVLFVFSMPIFFVSLLTTVNLIVYIMGELCGAKKGRKAHAQGEVTDKKDD